MARKNPIFYFFHINFVDCWRNLIVPKYKFSWKILKIGFFLTKTVRIIYSERVHRVIKLIYYNKIKSMFSIKWLCNMWPMPKNTYAHMGRSCTQTISRHLCKFYRSHSDPIVACGIGHFKAICWVHYNS